MASPIRSGLLQAGSGFLGRRISAWYRAGGAPLPVAVYQPKGAADLATSYVNLVTPGTNNATTAAAPTFAAATGWAFGGEAVGGAIITAPVVIANEWTVIVRGNITGGGGGNLGRLAEAVATWFMVPSYNGVEHRYKNGGATDLAVAGALTGAQTMAIANTKAYLNGVEEGNIAVAAFVTTALSIGNRADRTRTLAGNIYAVAIYNTTLTAAQVLAVSSAMALL
jgi:hypothetical protein